MSLINRKEYRKSDLRSVFRWMPSPLLRIAIIITMPIGLIGVLFSGWSVREQETIAGTVDRKRLLRI